MSHTSGLTPEEAAEKPYIASMGIYVFKKQVLINLLNKVRREPRLDLTYEADSPVF